MTERNNAQVAYPTDCTLTNSCGNPLPRSGRRQSLVLHTYPCLVQRRGDRRPDDYYGPPSDDNYAIPRDGYLLPSGQTWAEALGIDEGPAFYNPPDDEPPTVSELVGPL